jgi:hypothetical protein
MERPRLLAINGSLSPSRAELLAAGRRRNGIKQTAFAADSACDCERSDHGDGRTHSHDADDETGL